MVGLAYGPSNRARLLRAAPLVLALASLGAACELPAEGHLAPSRAAAAAPEERAATPSAISVDPLEVPGDVPAFVLRGARGTGRMVFLHGMCGHGQGYVQAFQGAAAEKGTVVALSGDVACGADPAFRKWGMDVERIDARIDAAFAAAGLPPRPGEGIVVIGMSQGALRAEALAQRFPEKYTHAVFMGSPRPPHPSRVAKLRGAVIMSGEHEGTWAMRQGALALGRIGVPATYVMIPDARHAELREGERVMDEALDWLWSSSRVPPGS